VATTSVIITSTTSATSNSLQEKLERFADELPDCACRVIFRTAAVTESQVTDFGLPTRSPKRETAADKNWPHDFACELDAIPPDSLREMVRYYIERHLSRHQLDILKIAEESERDGFRKLVGRLTGGRR
jgi:hypothetical protein